MKKIADGNYRELIADGITLVDFYATWCMPCLRMEKQIEDFASKNPNVNVYKYDVDHGVDIWNKVKSEFNIRSIPFTVIYQNGEVVASQIGYKSSEELQKILDNIK
jgi:thioredoxin 1